MVAIRLTMCTRPSGVSSSHACSTVLRPMAASCSLMYFRDCSIAAEPAGRGPIATSWRRCSHARFESNFGDVCPHAAIELTTINAEIAENTEKTNLLGDLCDLRVNRRLFMIAYRGGR